MEREDLLAALRYARVRVVNTREMLIADTRGKSAPRAVGSCVTAARRRLGEADEALARAIERLAEGR